MVMQRKDGFDALPLALLGCDAGTALLDRVRDQLVDDAQPLGFVEGLGIEGVARLFRGRSCADAVEPVVDSVVCRERLCVCVCVYIYKRRAWSLPGPVDLAKQVLVRRDADKEQHRLRVSIAHLGLQSDIGQRLAQLLELRNRLALLCFSSARTSRTCLPPPPPCTCPSSQSDS
jgi:hypothetical protein